MQRSSIHEIFVFPKQNDHPLILALFLCFWTFCVLKDKVLFAAVAISGWLSSSVLYYDTAFDLMND